MEREKVVITGYGIKVPGGYGVEHFTDTLLTERSALDLFVGEGRNIAFGVVHDRLENVQDKKYRRYPRISLLALAAANEAIKMSGHKNWDTYRTGVFMGTALGGTLGYD